jgi:hypothetical protein
MKHLKTLWIAMLALSTGLGMGASSAHDDSQIFIGAKCVLVCESQYRFCLDHTFTPPSVCDEQHTQCVMDCGQ